jgi:hypothetical protein
MKQNQVMGVLRAVLAGLGGMLGGSGVANESDWAQVSGAIMVLVAAIWSVIEKRKIALPSAAGMLMAFLMGGALLLSSGCASMLAVSSHDSDVQTKAKVIQAQALGNGGVALGVDWLGLNTGYLSAWKDQPAMMAGATGLDIITTLGAAYMLNRSQDGSDKGGGVTITGNGNIVTTGDSSPASRTTTTSTGAE